MKIHVNKKKWHFALLNGILILLFLTCAVVFARIAGTLDSIDAADRWRGESDMRFAQIGCFLPVDQQKSEDAILQFRQTLDQKMIDASLEAPEGGSLYADAYSGSGRLTVKGDHGSADVKAIGVGGSFFLFHPLQLRSGSYISETDLMQDRVVLDEALAWQLFGGPDVAGMTVTIQDKPYYVAGVIRRENDFASKEAYIDGAGMFLSYSAFHALTEQEITCYEIVLPDMITGFGKSLVDENFDVSGGDLVENSSRYDLGSLLRVIGDFGHRSMRNNGVIYPYWENAVRLTEDYLALLLVLMILFGICPAVCGIVLIIKALVSGWKTVKKQIPTRLLAMRERRREQKYDATMEK